MTAYNGEFETIVGSEEPASNNWSSYDRQVNVNKDSRLKNPSKSLAASALFQSTCIKRQLQISSLSSLCYGPHQH